MLQGWRKKCSTQGETSRRVQVVPWVVWGSGDPHDSRSGDRRYRGLETGATLDRRFETRVF